MNMSTNEEKQINVGVNVPFADGAYCKCIWNSDFEFTGRIMYQQDSNKQDIIMYVEVKYNTTKNIQVRKERKPRNFLERLRAVFFNETFEDIEMKKETKEVTNWVREDDVRIIINTICECQ